MMSCDGAEIFFILFYHLLLFDGPRAGFVCPKKQKKEKKKMMKTRPLTSSESRNPKN